MNCAELQKFFGVWPVASTSDSGEAAAAAVVAMQARQVFPEWREDMLQSLHEYEDHFEAELHEVVHVALYKQAAVASTATPDAATAAATATAFSDNFYNVQPSMPGGRPLASTRRWGQHQQYGDVPWEYDGRKPSFARNAMCSGGIIDAVVKLTSPLPYVLHTGR
jgi:hypothetical protein